MTPAHRASIVDVARVAGVSVATVSRALRGLENVSAATRAKVIRAAEDLEYTASPLASGLVTGRMRSVGVVTPFAGRWFFAEIVRGMEQGLREHGYDLVLHVLADPARRAQFFAELPVRRRVDALAVVALPLTPAELETLNRLRMPLSSAGEPLPGMHGERIDNVAAARLAVQHLVNLGHTRIAMIGGTDNDHVFDVPNLRTRGYEEALREARLGVREGFQVDGQYTAAGGEQAMAELLSRPERPTAVFCQSDEMAFGALRALRNSGLRCPQDVSLIGVDDHELAATFDMSTVAQPVAEQGMAAVQWLIQQLENPDQDNELLAQQADDGGSADVRWHPVHLVLRGSTGPPA